MNQYSQFIFKRYEFDRDSRQLKLYYGYDEEPEFCEVFKFDFDFVDYNEEALDRAIQLLFFVAGVSYFKLYLATEIVVQSGKIDAKLAEFLGKTYRKGLGEFFYVNQLDPNTEIVFPVNSEGSNPIDVSDLSGQLIGLGGGKDSLVSTELLRDQPKVATWSMNHRSQLQPLVERIGLPHYWVEREWDQQVKGLVENGALNGHIPISAIFAIVGTIVSILSGHQDNIVSNESSANEPTLTYQGVDINHQYSKSLEFENDFQSIIKANFNDNTRYYSLLRPYSELQIGEFFAQLGFDKYKDVFSSCNRAYTHDQDHMFWCGVCAKCAFVFLILSAFLERKQLEDLWHGRNLLLDPSLESMYRNLLGIEGDKPLDCVGEIKEARAAMRLAQQQYPELGKFQFDLPDDYDWRSLSQHSIPSEIYDILQTRLQNQQ